MNGATASGIIVTVPAAEEAVARHRAQFDWSARRGVPAHVTVLYPFVPPSEIDTQVIEAVAVAVASVPRFSATWEATGWFGSEVLWLSPQPADSFRALASVVGAAFPAYPPYGGSYPDVTPHLTVGHGVSEGQLREVEAQVLPHLPIRMDVTSAELWCGSDNTRSWHRVADLPLG